MAKFKKGVLGVTTNGKIRWGRERGKWVGIGRAWLNRKIMGRGRERGMRWMKGRKGRGRRGGGRLIIRVTRRNFANS